MYHKSPVSATKALVAEILGFHDAASLMWDIRDELGDLLLVHFTHNIPEEELTTRQLLIRGIVVDVVDKKVVCSGLPGFKTFHMESLQQRRFSGFVLDRKMNNVQFNTIFPYHEGILVRVFHYKGKVYTATAKKLNVFDSKSVYGGNLNLSIEKILKAASWDQVDISRLFEDPKNRDVIHHFVLEHPKLRTVSLDRSPPRVLYLGHVKRVQRLNKIVFELGLPPFLKDLKGVEEVKPLKDVPGTLFPKDQGHHLGEPVFAFRTGGSFLEMYRVCSPASSWRMNISKRNMSSPDQRLYGALNDVERLNNESLMKRYLPLDVLKMEPQDIINAGADRSLYNLPILEEVSSLEKEQLRKIVFANVVMSTPLALHKYMLAYLFSYDEMFSHLRTILNAIFSFEAAGGDPGDVELGEREKVGISLDYKTQILINEIKKDTQRFPMDGIIAQLPGGSFTKLYKLLKNVRVGFRGDDTPVPISFHTS